ncbi:hypothetical protein D3C72_978520 [compost metagenome]
MKSRIDPETIAKAMKAAAVVAKTGTREERSGKFIAPKAKPTRSRSGAIRGCTVKV